MIGSLGYDKTVAEYQSYLTKLDDRGFSRNPWAPGQLLGDNRYVVDQRALFWDDGIDDAWPSFIGPDETLTPLYLANVPIGSQYGGEAKSGGEAKTDVTT